jgi:hypothetical protein
VRRVRVAAILVGLLVPVMAVGIAQASGKLKSTLTVHTSPSHISKAPFTWKQTGTVVLPKKVCPNGANNPPYCMNTPKSYCNGTVSVTVRLGKDSALKDSGKKVATKQATVKNCSYSLKVALPKSVFTAKPGARKGSFVAVKFSDHYGGNSHAAATTARTRTVLAKVQ